MDDLDCIVDLKNLDRKDVKRAMRFLETTSSMLATLKSSKT